MTSTRSGSGGEQQEDPAGPRKRAYEAPRILYREPLEAMAAICAPAPPAKSNFGFCPQGPISS
jgi:hypothetical protein